MSTLIADIHKTLAAHFNTNWGSTTSISWPSMVHDPVSVPFVTYHMSFSDIGRYLMTGAPTTGQRIYGLVNVGIFTEQNKGDGAALVLADDVRDIFNEARIAVGSREIVFGATEINVVGIEDAFYRVDVDCPFDLIT